MGSAGLQDCMGMGPLGVWEVRKPGDQTSEVWQRGLSPSCSDAASELPLKLGGRGVRAAYQQD